MRKLSLLEWVLVAFVLGIIIGAIVGPGMATYRPFGLLFVRLLSMLVVPLIFTTLAAGVAGLSGAKLGRMFGKTFFYYYLTGVLAIILGLILANISQVGVGMQLGDLKKVTPTQAPAISQVLLDIVPTNPADAFARGAALQIIFFAILFGIAIGMAKERGEPVKKLIESIAETMYKLVEIVLYYAPIGVFFLIGWTVGTHGLKILKPFALLIILVYLGCALQILIIYAPLLRFVAKLNPFKFFAKIKEAPFFAFTTCSSSATLPVTMRVVKEAGVSTPTCGFVLPLGATVNMDGTAIYQAIAAVFLANAFGVKLALSHQVTIGITALLASIGTAGVPGAGLIMLTMVLTSVGIPLEGLALIAGIDRIMDMARTAVNVTDDAVAAALVGTTEGEVLIPELYAKGAKAV